MKSKRLLILILSLAVITIVVSGCLKAVDIQPEPDLNNNEVGTMTEDIDTSDWLTYQNEEYGFEVKYPEEWEVKETNFWSTDFEKNIKNISFKKDDYYLIFGVYKNGENAILGRTGVGAGDFKNKSHIKSDSINIEASELIYNEKIIEIYYTGSNDTYNLTGFFSSSLNLYSEDIVFNNEKRKIADKILETLVFD